MSSDKIVDLASYRRDGAAPLVADFWELATDGATCGGRLAVGKTSLSEVAHLIGIQPAEIDLDDTGVPGLFYWQHGELVWNFDASRRFVGLNFGGEPDNTMRPIVQLAVSRRELSTGDQLEIPPELELVPGIPLRLRGRRLDQFATLPRFLGSMHDVKIASTAVRGVEKSVRFEHEGAHGTVRTGFLMQVFGVNYVEQLYVDYCLHGIGLIVSHEVSEQQVIVPGGDPSS